MVTKPDPPINIEHRVDIVTRLRAAHQTLTQPWVDSIYSLSANEIEDLRARLKEAGQLSADGE